MRGLRGGHFIPAEMPASCAALTAASKAALTAPGTDRHGDDAAGAWVRREVADRPLFALDRVLLCTQAVAPEYHHRHDGRSLGHAHGRASNRAGASGSMFSSMMPSLYQLLPQAASLPVGHAGV